MGIIIISFIVGLAGILYSKYKDFDSDLGQWMFIIGFTVFGFSGISALVGIDVDEFDRDYSKIKYETLVYRNSTTPEDYNYLHTLDYEMNSMNNRIERNKKYSNNFWIGCFYDERISEYEKFDIKKELERK